MVLCFVNKFQTVIFHVEARNEATRVAASLHGDILSGCGNNVTQEVNFVPLCSIMVQVLSLG